MDDKDQLAGCSHRSVRDRKALSDLWGTLSELSGRALMCRQSFPLGETFELSGPQPPLPGDVAVFHFGLKAGLNPGRFGFLIGFVSFDFGVTTSLSCFRIWLDTVRDQPVPT
jgi:hypothetical protein